MYRLKPKEDFEKINDLLRKLKKSVNFNQDQEVVNLSYKKTIREEQIIFHNNISRKNSITKFRNQENKQYQKWIIEIMEYLDSALTPIENLSDDQRKVYSLTKGFLKSIHFRLNYSNTKYENLHRLIKHLNSSLVILEKQFNKSVNKEVESNEIIKKD